MTVSYTDDGILVALLSLQRFTFKIIFSCNSSRIRLYQTFGKMARIGLQATLEGPAGVSCDILFASHSLHDRVESREQENL
jgi:hypothetical protein